MEYAYVGNTGIRISRIGLGCMGLKPGNADHVNVVHRALECGVNYFDTADLYDAGLDEEMLGKALKGKREQVVIATKVGNRLRTDGSWDWDPSAKYVIDSVEHSLRRLGTDHIDLYQLHGGTIGDPIDETIAAFESLKAQGKIRHYGISSIRPNVIREWVRRSHMATVMMQYSLLDRRPEQECLDLLRVNGISVLVRGAVAQGLLVDKPAREYVGRSKANVDEARELVGRLSHGRSRAQTSIQFVLEHPAITCVVAGARTIGQLEDAADVFNVPWISVEEYDLLRNTIHANHYAEHT